MKVSGEKSGWREVINFFHLSGGGGVDCVGGRKYFGDSNENIPDPTPDNK